jgi:hypothetical protein
VLAAISAISYRSSSFGCGRDRVRSKRFTRGRSPGAAWFGARPARVLHCVYADASSTNSSPEATISWTVLLRPSSTASATPRAYSRIARLESSLPGIT